MCLLRKLPFISNKVKIACLWFTALNMLVVAIVYPFYNPKIKQENFGAECWVAGGYYVNIGLLTAYTILGIIIVRSLSEYKKKMRSTESLTTTLTGNSIKEAYLPKNNSQMIDYIS